MMKKQGKTTKSQGIPNKSRSIFQKTVRLGNKAGFGSSATRLNLPSKRGSSKIDTVKTNLSDHGVK